MGSQDSRLPVIIVGGGIVGLTLAQALKKEGIPFEIYERDEGLDSRSPGWAITIHWALDALESCLSPELFKRIDEIQVDPEQGQKGNLPSPLLDTGRFLFLDIETAEPKYIIPPSFRRRIGRLKFRKLLTEGIDINWGKSITAFETSGEGVAVSFADGADGTEVRGAMLVAADGSNSRTRSLLMGDTGKINQLPARFMGVTVVLSESKIAPLRAIDPLLFQGSHPETGYFMWFSVLSIPAVNGSDQSDKPYYEGQINVSWIVKGEGDEVPEAHAERLAKMKAMARAGSGFHHVLRDTIAGIPEGTEVLEIKLADWPTLKWESDSKVTLLGDAAHAMTMYRGEAANHGLTDAAKLKEQLKLWHSGSKTQEEAIGGYETEMRTRTHTAVLLSRQACLDAHDIKNLTPDSPLVGKRAKVIEAASKA
ncbi:Uu.00g090560.m01.CDS01 [Anthostomella pinea]|uniref:Uu.00g090560.m01.CDS01 n=1 Tax=Anthostomella pinea TaxID=933095 RepID=A0AAI8VP39_9PEZI|nr:Uu.00g090560.m01.CDS01 [Anthostomella pinea]